MTVPFFQCRSTYKRLIHILPCNSPFSFWLNTQQISNIREIDVKIIENANFYSISKGMISSVLRFEIINKDTVFLWINDPVFTDAGSTVFKQFGIVIHPPAGA